jgi:hypothetical protein
MKTTIVIEVEGGEEVDKRLDFLSSAEGQPMVAAFFHADQALSLEAGIAVTPGNKEELLRGIAEAIVRRAKIAPRAKASGESIKES